MGFALERVNHNNEVRILSEHKPYSCGRDKNSAIVCFSPTISRKHCIFYVGNEGVTVLDLQSSNGVYVNGNKIPPHNAVSLNIDDIVGLGSCALNNFATTDFVYRLKQWNENLTYNHSNGVFDHKRKLKIKTNNEVPCKIIKTEFNEDVELIEIEDEDVNMVDHKNYSKSSGLSETIKAYEKIHKSHEGKEQNNFFTSIHEYPNNDFIKESIVNASIVSQRASSMNSNEKEKELKQLSDSNSIIDNSIDIEGIKTESLNSVWIKYEVDIAEDEKIYDVLYASPLKIKMPKPQSKTRYSDIDGVVHLSDEDEDVFPCSQLFDDFVNTKNSELSINVNRIKNEQEWCEEDDGGEKIVEEGENENSEYLFNCEYKEPPFIILSDDDEYDDDDKDNPWIRRLLGSQSQRKSIIVESKNRENFMVAKIDLNENDHQLEDNIDIFDHTKLNTDEEEFGDDNEPKECDKKEQDKQNQIVSDITNSKDSGEDDNEEKYESEVSPEQKKENEKKNQRHNATIDQTKINSRPEAIDLHNSKTISVDRELDVTNIDSLNQEFLSETRSKQKIIDKLIAQSSKKTAKKIPQIEPPFLPRGERHGVSCGITFSEKSVANESVQNHAQHLNDNQITHENNTDISSRYKKYIAKESKQFTMQQKINETKYLKEQKLGRLKTKFADKLPLKNKRASFLSKEEKEERKQDRKERLKKIAGEKKQPNEASSILKRINKPKAKVSTRTRGDFLIADQLNALRSDENVDKSSMIETITIQNKKTKITPKTAVTNPDDSFIVTKLRDESVHNATKHDIKVIKIKNKNDKCNNTKNIFNNDNIDDNIKKDDSTEKRELLIHDVQIKLSDYNLDSKRKDIIAPVIMKVTEKPKTKKKVSFNEEMTKVHTFIIPEGNNLNKCVRTDLLLKERPPKKIASSNINDLPHPKLEEFLLRLFHWNPLWLEEQKSFKSDPPVVDQKSLIPVLTKYKSYEDYYKIISPLLALEIWHGLLKDFKNCDLLSKRITLQASIVENSVTRTPIPSTNLTVTTFMVEALATKNDIQRQSHPIYGDLVVFELATMHKGRVDFLKIFAYVTSVMQTVLTAFTRYNPDLAKYVKNPHTLLTYTMITRPININIQTNVVQRLKTVSYLRSSIRMIQAIQYLPMSPLSKLILKPDVEAYKLPAVTNVESYSLVTKDNLNSKQLEAVLRITDTIIQRVPKISMIQGPPGTGKSKVIVNIITEILYGANRYQNKKHPRILVCAPSNAAIDEIVLRLLTIRAKFQPKEQRFRMVRLGRTDTMNPSVKSISVTELAKRDVDKTMMECCATDRLSLESIEMEKSFLLGRINAITAEIESSTIVDISYKQHLERKLAALKIKYDFLNNQHSKKNIDRKLLSKLHRSAENTILTCADIITCTLSSCYTNQMEAHFGGTKERISVCIVDEATQSIEAETLIPLMLGVTTLVLVGDPNQLPATVISQQAKKLGMDQSLFARLQGSFDGNPADPVIMLDTQYRMSYPISYWPNRYFYGNRLKNCAKMRALPFHFYKILNLTSKQDSDRFSNTNEAAFVANIIFTMMIYSNLDKLDNILRIGIITPYNNQRTVINAKLKERLTMVPENLRKKVITEVNTVDSFQGQERDVVIMSCVRSNGIGFLSDRQRLCVALTRAKHTLIICGNFKAFEKNEMWQALLTDARSRGVYFNVDHNSTPSELKKHIIK